MDKPEIRQEGDETVIDWDDSLPVAIAIRTASNPKTGEKRMLITVRAGAGAENIVFNFGSYGGGVQTFGGGDGGPPPPPDECP
jgi:hypothetical protein